MARSVIVGSGSEIPPTRVTNGMLARLMDTSDEWIRERSGVETRHYVLRGTGTSDLGVAAARRALEQAGVAPEEVDLVVFATMTPDHYFPGSGALLQAKLGLRDVPCFDIRQQCVGFLYGLQLVDAHVRAGLAQTVLLVGAEVHTGFLPWTAANWEYMLRTSDVPPTTKEYDWNTKLPPPHRALRGRGGGRRGEGGAGRRARDPRPPPPHGRPRLRQALRARHGVQAPAVHGPRAVRARRPHPLHGRPFRVQDGDHEHGGVGAGDPGPQRAHRRRPVPRADAPGQPADQRVLPEGRWASPTGRSSTTSTSTGTRPPPPSRCSGTRRRGRAGSSPATSS